MTNLTLTPEEQFILNCLRLEFGKGDNNSIASLDIPSMNWDNVYKKSAEWNIVPLLHTIIKKQHPFVKTAKIPEHFFKRMKLEHFKACLAYDAMRKSLFEVLEVFHKENIRVVLLKGSHMAQFVYQCEAVRPMGDIDILIKKDDLQKAEALLLRMGYYHENEAKSNLHLPYFLHPKGMKPLEVHWTITKPIWKFNIDLDGIWERAKIERKNRIDMLVFSLEDLLLYLSLHATYQHNLRALGIIPFCDIAAIIHRFAHDIDWAQLKQRASDWGINKYLYLALRLSHEVVGANVPDHILHTLEPRLFNSIIVLEAINRILSINEEKVVFSDSPHLFYEGIHPNNSLTEKFSFFFRRIFISSESLASHYTLSESSKSVYFYYFIHFISLLYRYIPYYVLLFIYYVINGKKRLYTANLDLWLMTPDLERKNN